MSTILGTKQGLENMATQPASKGTINGVRIEVVALCVAGKAPADISENEERIAAYVARVGKKLEQQGWLPDLRHRRMLDCIVREASLVPPEMPLVEPGIGLGATQDGETAASAEHSEQGL